MAHVDEAGGGGSPAPPPRLRGGQGTREALRGAAAAQFARDGFSMTTVRSIAAEVGVNPALVIRHFGSKEALFLQVMQMEEPVSDLAPAGGRRFAEVLPGPVATLGVRLAGYVLQEAAAEQSQLRDVFIALSRAADVPGVREQLGAIVAQQLVRPIASRLHGASGELRAQLIAIQLSGLMAALWVNADPVVRDLDHDQVLVLYGRAMQVLVDDSVTERPPARREAPQQQRP